MICGTHRQCLSKFPHWVSNDLPGAPCSESWTVHSSSLYGLLCVCVREMLIMTFSSKLFVVYKYVGIIKIHSVRKYNPKALMWPCVAAVTRMSASWRQLEHQNIFLQETKESPQAHMHMWAFLPHWHLFVDRYLVCVYMQKCWGSAAESLDVSKWFSLRALASNTDTGDLWQHRDAHTQTKGRIRGSVTSAKKSQHSSATCVFYFRSTWQTHTPHSLSYRSLSHSRLVCHRKRPRIQRTGNEDVVQPIELLRTG